MSHNSGTIESTESAEDAVTTCSLKDEEDPPVRLTEMTSLLDSSGSPEDGGTEVGNEITDVIGLKPTTKMLRYMNTPVVPEGILKERPRVTGSVRMKNVGSPSK